MSSLMEKLGGLFNKPAPVSTPAPSTSPSPASAPELKQTLQALIDPLKEAVIILDQKQQVVMINRSALSLTTYQLREIQARPFSQVISLVDNKDQPVPLQTGSEPVTLTAKNQHQAKVMIQVLPLPTPDLAWALILEDVTKQHALEDMQIDFVSMASHELRTPLTSISNYLSILDEEVKAKLDPEHQEFLDRSLSNTKQLLALVENLLSVSRIERGATPVNLKPTDWGRIASQIVKDNQMLAAERKIQIILEPLPPNLPQVWADNLRIGEVLTNLISNALKHTPPNGTVTVKVAPVGAELVTSVADTGEGIPKEALAHLFAKFYRVPGSLERMNAGTGLGLYISKSLIDLHHGRIWVESEVGKGSTFYFSLPIVQNLTPTIATNIKTSSDGKLDLSQFTLPSPNINLPPK